MRAPSALSALAPVVGLALVAAPAAADTNDEISIGSFARALPSTSAKAVAPGGLDGGTLAYARALPVSPLPGLGVWATASMAWGAADGTLFQTMATSIDTFGLALGGRASYELHPRLALGARLELGSTRTALELGGLGGGDVPGSAMGTLTDAGWAATAAVAAGVDARVIAMPRFALGVRFEVGHVVASSPELAPRGSVDEEVIMLPVSQASIGSLDLGGSYVSFLVVSAF